MSQTPPKRASAGSILIEVALIAWCGFRLWQGNLGTGWRVAFVVMIGFSAFALFAKLFARGVGGGVDEQSAAEGIHNLQKGMYSGVHEMREVDDSALRGLDESFYERATAELEGLGFRRLGQVVDVTAARVMPQMRAVLRCFVSGDGTTMGAVYNVKMRSWYRALQIVGVLSRNLRTVDLETELSDGRFVTTSNATDAAKASDFTGIHRRFFPKDVPIAELVEHHRRHVQECLSIGGDGIAAEPVVITDFAALRASQDRLQLLKSKHRASAAFDPGEEIARVTGKPLNAQQQVIAEQVRQMRDAERRGA